MSNRRRAWMSWSSGKDSTMALSRAMQDPSLEVVGLLTSLNADADRVAMHAVRRSLLEAQADRLGLGLHTIELPASCSNEIYEARMAGAIEAAKADEIEVMVFGDLFLQDIRAYREQQLAPTGLVPHFPLWGENTAALAQEMVDAGVRAILTSVDPRQCAPRWVGREFSELLAELPDGVDPCGERGEFHTFVYDGPGFRAPIEVEVGETVERDGFFFADVAPAGMLAK